MKETMQNREWLVFRILVNRFHQKSPETFLKALPKETYQKVLEQEVLSEDTALLLAQPQELMSKVHYSWLADAFKKLPEPLKHAVLSALPAEAAEGISRQAQIQNSRTDLSPPIKRFLASILYKHFEKKNILPVPFLPKTPLSQLADKSKNQLIELIDFLSLYDLAEELRHIVDKNTIKHIYSTLSALKQRFLRACLYQKEKLIVGRLDVNLAIIDRRQLGLVLHKRGILRLAKALSGQHPDLLWHIAHTLDSGRGQLLMRYYKEQEIAGISPALSLQVMNVLNILSKSET